MIVIVLLTLAKEKPPKQVTPRKQPTHPYLPQPARARNLASLCPPSLHGGTVACALASPGPSGRLEAISSNAEHTQNRSATRGPWLSCKTNCFLGRNAVHRWPPNHCGQRPERWGLSGKGPKELIETAWLAWGEPVQQTKRQALAHCWARLQSLKRTARFQNPSPNLKRLEPGSATALLCFFVCLCFLSFFFCLLSNLRPTWLLSRQA